MSTFACPLCKKEITAAALFAELAAYAPPTAHFTARCPACRDYLEFQARAGQITLGYTYWAGSMHFEGVVDAKVPGLQILATTQPPALQLGETVFAVANPPRPNADVRS
jgi:hypothetical protein